MIKLRKIHPKDEYGGHVYYLPELNGNESAIVYCGHHSVIDGITAMQGINLMSDAPYE